jgi:hypothetical protein
MVAYQLTTTGFTPIILPLRYFFAVFLYFFPLAIGTMERYAYSHLTKIRLFILIAKFL